MRNAYNVLTLYGIWRYSYLEISVELVNFAVISKYDSVSLGMRIFYRALILLVLLSLPSLGTMSQARDGKGRFVVVVDAGHGGKDSGAVGKRSKEKNIVLDVALKVGERINVLNPNIVVYYTRKDDRFIGLQQRADFANKKKADLFVSVHANSHKTSRPHGSETYVLGLHRTQDNLDVAMKENSVILYEKDHGAIYKGFDPNESESYIIFNFIQNKHLSSSINLAELIQGGMVNGGLGNRGVKQAGFLVLREVAMPSVLVELGFISNPSDEEYMLSKNGSRKLAQSIAQAVVDYEAKISGRGGGSTKGKEVVAENAPEVASQSVMTKSDGKVVAGEIHYRVQVMADTRKLKPSYFGSYRDVVKVTKEGKYYKYTFYDTTSLDEAKGYQRDLRRKYKDCFIVGFDGEGNKVGSYY